MLARPAGSAFLQRQHIACFAAQTALEHPRQAGAQFGVFQFGVARIDIVGKLALLGQVVPEILESGNDIGAVQTEPLPDGLRQRLGIRQGRFVILVLGRDALSAFP